MSSYRKFSHRSRQEKDSDGNLFNSPHLIDRSLVNEQYVKSFQDLKPKWQELCSYFRYYPDRFVDFIKPEDCRIDLYFYQRVYLRIMMRYQKVYITATRGTTKSFLGNLAIVLKSIFYPNSKFFTCAPRKEQAAKISQERLNEIFDFYPLLRAEVRTFTESKDYTRLIFHNGSRYDVVQVQDAARGGRRNGGAIEEIADKKFNGDMLNSVVIPLCANDRIAMCGGVDPNELHKFQVYITTAGTQQQFAYEKMREIHQDMLQGKPAFNIGNGWELPVMHGQLDEDFVLDLRESPTFSISDFQREYESIWTGTSSDSLVSDEKLLKTRKLKIAEWEHCGDEDVEYILSYDVSVSTGTNSALSCLAVIKITPQENGTYSKELVNIFSREGEHGALQAEFLKEKVEEFKARILIVDANGPGQTVVDALQMDLGDGNPPYEVVNDSDYDKYRQPNSIPILFALKSQSKETKQGNMINHFIDVFSRRGISLLVQADEGVKALEKYYKRKIKESEEIANFSMPYLYTDMLCEEIMNLRYKQSGNDAKVEQISKRIEKDKFTALMYGLYWIYLQERDNAVQRQEVSDISDFFFISNPFPTHKIR